VASIVVLVILVLRASSARHDFVSAFERFQVANLPWLVAAAAAQILSLGCYAGAQRRLLRAGDVRLAYRSVLALTIAATGITALVPGGVVPASGWLIGQYRRRGVGMRLAAWTVLAGGFAATVAVLALLLIGAAMAGLGRPLVLGLSGAVLAGGSAGFVVMVHHLDRLERFLRRHHLKRGVKVAHWSSAHVSELARFRIGILGGSEVLGFSAANWLLDTVCLLCAFAFVGLPVPWHSALFAYAVSQVAASLLPLPAGIGVVEGGMVGVFAATGTPAGQALVAIIVYRIVNYWAVAAVGSAMAITISHRPPGQKAVSRSKTSR
jgi:uncharacterized membrane protein YbhN (UPF0104 family)